MKHCRTVSAGVGAGVLLTLGALLASATAPALAHERRVVGPAGQYTLLVGLRNEPAYEDDVNAVDVTVTRSSDGRALDASGGDVVDLRVQVQLRATEAFVSQTVQSAELDPLQQPPGLARYFSPFRPTVNGTYAFLIRGVVSDASAPLAGPLAIEETFVCGRGTRGAQPFHCVRDPLSFPKGIGDVGGFDRHGYRDDDSLRPFLRGRFDE